MNKMSTNSSPPAATAEAEGNVNFEKIYPGIYLTSVENLCSADDLKLYGFTHIIYIDKHITEEKCVDFNANHTATGTPTATNASTINGTPATAHQSNGVDEQFCRNGFEILDLNFGESSYLTTVLPNCYKAVKFIDKALKNNGAVLVIDRIGGNQKCITIVVGFLMYKYNKSFL